MHYLLARSQRVVIFILFIAVIYIITSAASRDWVAAGTTEKSTTQPVKVNSETKQEITSISSKPKPLPLHPPKAKPKFERYPCDVDSTQWDVMAFHRKGDGKSIWIYKSENLKTYLKYLFPNAHIIIRDGKYAIVDQRWFDRTFFPEALRIIKKNYPYSKQFDCDKISSYFVHLAVFVHNKTNSSCDGVAIGEVYFSLGEKKSGHAANLVILCDGKSGGQWAVYDATGKGWHKMTDAERKSAWFIKF